MFPLPAECRKVPESTSPGVGPTCAAYAQPARFEDSVTAASGLRPTVAARPRVPDAFRCRATLSLLRCHQAPSPSRLPLGGQGARRVPHAARAAFVTSTPPPLTMTASCTG